MDGQISKVKVKRKYLLKDDNQSYYNLDSIDLLPGDIIFLKKNDYVPCDCIIIDGECIINESDLESFIDILIPKLQSTENNALKENLLQCLEKVTKYNEYYGQMYKVEEITELMEDFESAENQSEEARKISKQIVANITNRQGKNKKVGSDD